MASAPFPIPWSNRACRFPAPAFPTGFSRRSAAQLRGLQLEPLDPKRPRSLAVTDDRIAEFNALYWGRSGRTLRRCHFDTKLREAREVR